MCPSARTWRKVPGEHPVPAVVDGEIRESHPVLIFFYDFERRNFAIAAAEFIGHYDDLVARQNFLQGLDLAAVFGNRLAPVDIKAHGGGFTLADRVQNVGEMFVGERVIPGIDIFDLILGQLDEHDRMRGGLGRGTLKDEIVVNLELDEFDRAGVTQADHECGRRQRYGKRLQQTSLRHLFFLPFHFFLEPVSND